MFFKTRQSPIIECMLLKYAANQKEHPMKHKTIIPSRIVTKLRQMKLDEFKVLRAKQKCYLELINFGIKKAMKLRIVAQNL